MMNLNINRDKRIDFNNLHFEWAFQCDLSDLYGQAAAEARNDERIAEEKRRVRKSQAIKQAFETFKNPVDKVKAEAELNADYIVAINEHIAAQYRKDQTENAVKSIDTKKKALEEILKSEAKRQNSEPIEPKEYVQWRKTRFTEESNDEIRLNAMRKATELLDRG